MTGTFLLLNDIKLKNFACIFALLFSIRPIEKYNRPKLSKYQKIVLPLLIIPQHYIVVGPVLPKTIHTTIYILLFIFFGVTFKGTLLYQLFR